MSSYSPTTQLSSGGIIPNAVIGKPAAGSGNAQVRSRLDILIIIALSLLLCIGTVCGDTADPGSESPDSASPRNVLVTVYVVDFNRVDINAGTVGIDFYLHLTSNETITISDIELMNGMITSTSLVKDTPNEKEYRIIAVLTIEPDLLRYPFDSHTLAIKLEPALENEQEMILTTNQSENGIGPDADLPGWEIGRLWSDTRSVTYMPGEQPYSRIVFAYDIERDTTSTILKFFLPVILILIVSLSSLFMRISSRLALNSSMFLSVVMIHWRIVDNIPSVTYATFLDLFMVITYGTLVMVLISGILILKAQESDDIQKVFLIHRWSVRLIPPVSIILYLLLIAVFFLFPS